MVHPAADAAWKTKKTKSGLARDTSAKVIIQDGWSVPVVHSFEEFQLTDMGICLATRSEAEEAMRELNSKSKHLRACQQFGSVTWCSWEPFQSHTSVPRQEEELWRPTPPL